MKDIDQIKQELKEFGIKHHASPAALNTIKGNNLKELFENINKYIDWCKNTLQKKKEFDAIWK